MVDVSKAVSLMREMCDRWSLGYSQPDRWDIRPGGSADCSSITAHAYNLAGVTPPFPREPHAATYTGSWRKLALERGFTAEEWDWHDENDLTAGDLLLSEADSGGVGHIAMYVGGGLVSEAWINEIGDIEGGAPGDQTGTETHTSSYGRHPYTRNGQWTHVLYPPKAAFRSAPQGGMLSRGGLDFSDSDRLVGADVSNHQEGFDPREFPGDFVIVLATEGAGWSNPDFAWQYDTARSAGKLVGAYHFARNGWNSPEEEAEDFIATVGNRFGTGLIILDWEHKEWDDDGNLTADYTWDVGWAYRWIEIVRERTGITPLIYMSQSVTVEHDWASVAKISPLWVADYRFDVPDMHREAYPGTVGAWVRPLIWQYTDEGRAGGYPNDLDLNVAYMSRLMWDVLSTGGTATQKIRKLLRGGPMDLMVHGYFGGDRDPKTGKIPPRYFAGSVPFIEFLGEDFATAWLQQRAGQIGSIQSNPTFMNEHVKVAMLQGANNLAVNGPLTSQAILKDLLAQQKATNKLLEQQSAALVALAEAVAGLKGADQ